MLKTLSPKTLEKKYAELGLPKEKNDLLHTFFTCCANLYGVISLRDAWNVFKHYEGTYVHKKDFVAFSGIVQREAGHTYSVLELKEIYSGENTDDPLERMIVNNKLILSRYHRFILVYATVERQGVKPYYMPDKLTLLSFVEDRFYQTESGKKIKAFIDNLKSDGQQRDYMGNPTGTISDVNGLPVKGKKLSEFTIYTSSERYEIEQAKTEAKKQRLIDEYKIPSSEKILNRIFEYIMTGGVLRNESLADELQFLTKEMNVDFGIVLSIKQVRQFTELFVCLNNSSNLWLNCGWSPEDLSGRASLDKPKFLFVGPNMKKLFETGELDREDFERQLREEGIELIEDV